MTKSQLRDQIYINQKLPKKGMISTKTTQKHFDKDVYDD